LQLKFELVIILLYGLSDVGVAKMKRNQKSEVHLRERVIHELKEFAVIAAYLFVCFTALACLKAAILKAYGISRWPGVAVNTEFKFQTPNLVATRTGAANLPSGGHGD
jgi:hypothetical protein